MSGKYDMFLGEYREDDSGSTPGDPGADGREIEIQKGTTHIQWRYVGDSIWNNLIAIADITGADGIDGTDGTNGADGQTREWLYGTGTPSDGVGDDGDRYLEDDGKVWTKEAGHWSFSGIDLSGPKGDVGVDGKTVRNGSGAPASGLGVDGDFYIDTANNKIYGPKTGGSWGSGVNLVGPQGPAGSDGANGGTDIVLDTTPQLGGDLDLNAKNLVSDATTGTKVGTSETQKLGFYGATPIVRPGAYTQTYATSEKTVPNPTAAPLTNNTGGTADTTLAAIGTTYSQATIRNNFSDLAAMVNKNTADYLALAKVVNAIIDDLQALGFTS